MYVHAFDKRRFKIRIQNIFIRGVENGNKFKRKKLSNIKGL